jgi:hypothetical protein
MVTGRAPAVLGTFVTGSIVNDQGFAGENAGF